MSWIIYFVLISVNLISFVRLLRNFRTQNLIERDKNLIFFGFHILFVIFLSIFLPTYPVFLTILLFSPHALVFLLPKIMELQRKRHFFKQELSILNSLLLKTNTGVHILDALVFVANGRDFYTKSVLLSISNRLRVARELEGLGQSWRLEKVLSKALLQSHKSREYLVAYRYELVVRLQFAKKLSRALLQIKAQSIILGFIYILLLVYLSAWSSLKPTPKEVSVSIAMFLLGSIWLFKIGKGRKWKT